MSYITKRKGTVHLAETTARDGIQNIKAWIPTEKKVELFDLLMQCGFKSLELTSFVNPKAVPQMADADEVAEAVLKKYHGQADFSVLVPNYKGAERAVKYDVTSMGAVCSATEEHNQANIRQTIDQTMEGLKRISSIKGKIRLNMGVVTAFVCPFTGPVDPYQVVRLIYKARNAGVDQFGIADTTGTANPLMIERLIGTLQKEFPDLDFSLHLHDTNGSAVANLLTALNMGVTSFSTGIAGLGGCPFTPGAAGNIATEDVVGMLEGMGIRTGISLEKIYDVIDFLETIPGANIYGRMAIAYLAKKHPCAS